MSATITTARHFVRLNIRNCVRNTPFLQFARLAYSTTVSTNGKSGADEGTKYESTQQYNSGATDSASVPGTPTPIATRTYIPGPNVPKLGPLKSAKMLLRKGEEVWICTCGLTETSPFCDGSHENTKFEPIMFVAPEEKMYSFCQCKYSNRMPFCDGEHKKFPGYVPPAKKI